MKKIPFLLALFLIFSCKTTKQSTAKIVFDLSNYKNSITEAELKTHLYVVASDSMEGRQTGSIGQKRAGNYLIKQYKKNQIEAPVGASDYYQKIASEFLQTRGGAKLEASENICAFIKGTEKPEEIIVISAHYDHIGARKNAIFYGADDNATGTVALLEIAQAFKKAQLDGFGPKRSVLFLHVTGEEHGLLGSKYYANHPLFSIANTVCDLNIDMIGRRDEDHPKTNNYVYVIGADRLSTDLHNCVIEANKAFCQLDLDYKYNDPNDPNHYYERSDHYNFAKLGIPSVFLFNGVHADYHRATDTADKIEFDALAKRTQLAFVIAWEIANRKDRIAVDKK